MLTYSVVPARAGMSPHDDICGHALTGGPRASGDEPLDALTPHLKKGWSPRERG